MAPIVHGLEYKYGDRMQFTYLDIDDSANNRFKQALDYRYQPHLFLLDPQGSVLKQWVGFVSAQDLEAAILAELTN
jgi:hypothetical protein